MRFFPYICFIAIFVAIAPALAEEDAIQAEAPIPATEATAPVPAAEVLPSRVGRLSFVSGNVGLRISAEASWADAELNQPVITGEGLRTDAQAHAEIQIGGNTIDLSNSTELKIAILSDRVIQIAVLHGRINLHLRQVGDSESVEIDSPRGSAWLLEPGYYDIDAGSGDQPLRLTVVAGSARFGGGGADARIEAGEMAVSTGSETVTVTTDPVAPDAFVEWCRARDYDETRLIGPYYISAYMTGLAELDSAGTWRIHSEYGDLWVPTAPAEWAPYRYGHWSWMAPWGWTWIDDQPWGFAPSHYGRWALIDDHWAWVPGSFVARPLYAAAVVAFLGTPRVGLSFEEGAAIGWFPLAPGEAYWPSYTRDLDYVRNLNLGNVQDVETIRMQADGEPPLEVVNQEFANRRFATVVPRPVFINGRPVAPALVTLPEQRLQNAPVLMGSPQIAPPSAQRVARAATTTVKTRAKSGPANRVAIKGSRMASGTKSSRAVWAQPRGHVQPSVNHGAHLRAPSYAGLARGRHVIVLRVADTLRGGAGKGTRH
jgi:uncharacterized protein DUF6600